MRYECGDYNQTYCEIWTDDGEYIGDVRTRDAIVFRKLLNKQSNAIRTYHEAKTYKHFTDEVLKLMSKYEISSLAKLDQILFNQKVW